MLLRFTVENMFTVKERQTLYVSAASSCKDRAEDNTFGTGDFRGRERALKSIAIYGANASGKTNFLRSLYVMVDLVRHSAERKAPLAVSPFLFDGATRKGPSRFEVEFVIEGVRYRYGFAATQASVSEEWLYRKDISRKGTQEHELFARYQEDGHEVIQPSRYFEKADRKVVEKTRADALFLSVAANLAVPEAQKIAETFFDRIVLYSATWSLCTLTTAMMQDRMLRERIIRFLCKTDETIRDIVVSEQEPHVVLGGAEGKDVVPPIPMEKIVSLGTMKAFRIAGPMFETLDAGGVMVIDELDRSMHPILVRQIIRLFNSRETNPKGAQLIFNTHDTNLLNDKVYVPEKSGYENLMRRDQIYFMERDAGFASHLYSLVEFKREGGRKKESIEADYLNGLYGSIPYIGKLV